MSDLIVIKEIDTGPQGVPGPRPWAPVAPWASGAVYVSAPPSSVVSYDSKVWVCTTGHTAGASFDDTKWAAIVDLSSAVADRQPLDDTLTALAALTTAADRLIYATGNDTFALATFTSYARQILAGSNAAAVKTLLSLVKADVGLGNVDNTSDANKPVSTAQATADGLRVLKAGDTMTGPLVLPADPTLALQAATKQYVDQIVAAQDAMVFKGVIDCSANPNYPAADRGWTYRVSVAGKIGGASGVNVEAGDILICLTDGTSSGDQAAVGASWSVIQTNIDGAVTLTGTQTLTNKTLTSPSISSPTGLVKGDVGLGNVDNTSDETKWAATATLTNKTFDTAGAGNSLSINGVAATANTGTGAVVRDTAPTFQTSATFSLGASANAVLARASDATTFNLLSLNGLLTTAGALGVYGGGDTSLYLNALTGGAVQFRIAGSTQALVEAGAFYPVSNNTKTSGKPALNWSATYSVLYYSGTLQVVGARKTGWAVASGTATRTTFDTATVTTAQLAERVKALIDDLHATAGHGLIGA